MGWGSAGEIYERVARSMSNSDTIDFEDQAIVLTELYEVLTDMDWDTCDESFGASPAGDKVLYVSGHHP